MSSLDLVKQYYDHFNAKNFEGQLSLLTEDVIHDINQGERQVGRETFKSFLAMMDTNYDEFLDNMVIMASTDGKRASAEFICNGTYKVSADGLPAARGQKYRLPVGAFFDIKDGKIARVTNYYNLEDWINQVK